MKYGFIIHILLLSAFAVAQDQPGKSQQLNQSVATLYQSGKYDEAIPVAEEIVKLERREGSAKTKNLVNALENLALIKLSRFKRSLAELNSGALGSDTITTTVARYRGDAESSEAVLREAIQLADAGPADFREQRIAMRNSLAWLLYNYHPPDPEVSVAFDKESRDKFEMRAKAGFYKRINEAQNLYLEASKLGTADPGANDNSALLTVYNSAEFALATGDLENAIARLEKCIAEVERIYGKNSPNLEPPLELYIRALTATSQDDLAFELLGRLVRVTGKSAGPPKTLLNISLRTDKAFAPSNSTSVEENARANKERATLAGRSLTVNGPPGAVLGASTVGREFYDISGSINITRVAVKVLIDETGRVIEAEGMTSDKERKRDAETAVKKWKFRPFVVAGAPRKVKGYVESIILANRLTK